MTTCPHLKKAKVFLGGLTDDHVAADGRGTFASDARDVQDRPVTDGGARSDSDLIDVPSHDRPVPDRRTETDLLQGIPRGEEVGNGRRKLCHTCLQELTVAFWAEMS